MLCKKKITNGTPLPGAPLLCKKKITNGAPTAGAPLVRFPLANSLPLARSPSSLSLTRSTSPHCPDPRRRRPAPPSPSPPPVSPCPAPHRRPLPIHPLPHLHRTHPPPPSPSQPSSSTVRGDRQGGGQNLLQHRAGEPRNQGATALDPSTPLHLFFLGSPLSSSTPATSVATKLSQGLLAPPR